MAWVTTEKEYDQYVQKHKTRQSYNLPIPLYLDWESGSKKRLTNFLDDHFNSCLSNEQDYGYHFVVRDINDETDILYTPNSYYILKNKYKTEGLDKPKFLQHKDVAVIFAELYNSELDKFEKVMLVTKPHQEPYVVKLGQEFYSHYFGYAVISHHFDENDKYSMTLAVNAVANEGDATMTQSVYQFSEDSQDLKLLHQLSCPYKNTLQIYNDAEANLSYHIVGQEFKWKDRMDWTTYRPRYEIPLASTKSFDKFSPVINGSGVLPLDIMFNDENSKGLVELFASFEGKGLKYSNFEAIFNLDCSHLLIKPSTIEFESKETHAPVLFGVVINLMDFLKAVVEKTTENVNQYAKAILEQNNYESDFFEIGANRASYSAGFVRLVEKPFQLVCEPFRRTFILNCYDTANTNGSKSMRGFVYCNDNDVQYKTIERVLKKVGDEKKDIVLRSQPLGIWENGDADSDKIWLRDSKRSFVFMSEEYYKCHPRDLPEP